MAKDVVMLVSDFPPAGGSGSLRATKLVKYLPDFGWRVTVVCPGVVTHHDPSLLGDIPPGTAVHRAGGPARLYGAGLDHTAVPTPLARVPRRAAKALLWPDSSVLCLPSLLRGLDAAIRDVRPDAVLSTAPPFSMALAGLLSKRRHRSVPWICDHRDPWPDALMGWRRRPSRALQRRWTRAADVNVYATEAQRVLAEELCPAGGASAVVPNGFDMADLDGLAPLPPPPENGELRITHTGALLGERVGTCLVPVLERLAADAAIRARLRVEFVGEVAPPLLARMRRLEGLVELHPRVPYREALRRQARSHALLLVVAGHVDGRVTVPNKLFEYLAVRRPVLNLAPRDGEAAALVAEHGAGTTVDPGDAESLASVLRAWLSRHERGEALARPATLAARFERRAVAGEMARVLDQAS